MCEGDGMEEFDKSSLYYVDSTPEGTRYSLYDTANWKNGLAFKNIDFSESGLPVIKIAELNNGISSSTAYTDKTYSQDVFLTKGDYVFSWSGNPETSIDIYKYNLPDGWLNQHIFKVTPKTEIIDKGFFFYLMKFLKPYFKKIATNKQTTGLGHVTISDLQRMSVALPPLPTQQKIAAILSSLDDKIELNNKINTNLEQQAGALFKNWFVDGSEKSHTIGDYIVPKRGKNLLSKDAIPGEVPVVAGGLEPATYHNTANTKAPVLTISASGANAGFVNLWNIPVWSSDSSYIDSEMTNDVYFWYILLKLRQKEIFDSQTGSAQPHIYPQHISVMPISELDFNKVSLFTKQVTPFFEQIGANQQENLRLITLRDTLLPKLMNGEIEFIK